jgi:uncharacterized protein YhaN
VRIERIRVGAFGRLRELDTGPGSLEHLVVVLGPNEAGKSTLFTFLTTALYGFQPATRERNPHVPWGTGEASGLVRVRLHGDGCAEIERTLRSQPVGRLTVNGQTTDLRNQAVPWVGHVPRTVFRQVFAITLAELAGLDGETWARIQDKVIGSMGAADLNSARAVADALEREAGEIWRPNRRGNQRLRALQVAIRDLRGRRGTARQRDTHIRQLVEEREHIRAELSEVRERRHRDRAEVERAQSLLPVKRQLERISTLRAEGGPPEVLRGLPPDPPLRWAELRALHQAMDESLAAVEREIGERESTIAQAASVAETLLESRDEIVRLVARAAGCAPDRVRAVELEGEIEDAEARMDVAASAVLEGSWRDVASDALTSIPIELLSESIANGAKSEVSPETPGRAGHTVTWLALGSGAILLGWGLTADQPVATALGAATIAAALTLWLTGRRAARVTRSSESGGGDAPRTGATSDLATLLDRLSVREEHLARPGEALVTRLERLRELSRTRGELTRTLEAARERVLRVDADARELALSLGRDDTPDAEVIARDLDRDIRDAERLQDAALGAQRDVRRLRLERDSVTQTMARLEAEIGALADRAKALAPGDVKAGLEEGLARVTAHQRADQLEDELRRSHTNLAEIRAQIDELSQGEHSWSVDEDALARARARIEAHDERIEQLLTQGEALEGEAARLRNLETVDAVDSEITSLRDEESRLTRARDRKWVLARVLREADRRFREEHQPDLVRRAGSYLEHLTGGRYERLIIDEANGEHLFHLVGPTLPAPVPLAPPVSTGTLEQAYLSLRLAIVDHLDQGGEKLPLFVDEIFVNWDGERRARGLEVLAGIANSRQVFVFTCHPSVAAELEQRGARVLELDRLA